MKFDSKSLLSRNLPRSKLSGTAHPFPRICRVERLLHSACISARANYGCSFLEAEHSGQSAIPPPRVIYANFYFKGSPDFHETLVDISAGKVMWQHNLGTKVHAPGTPHEMEHIHNIAMASDLVKDEIKRLKLVE